MTDRVADIASLLERVKAATEGDCDLDREIALALGWTPPAMGLPHWHDDDGNHWTALPDWSTSIDAALALVERLSPIGPMTAHSLSHSLARDGEEWWNFRIKHYVDDEGEPPKVHYGTAYTAPLAILIALLTALKENHRG